MTAKKTILLTGFGPFPGVADNATARLVPRLADAARVRWPAMAVVAEVLATEWQTATGRLGELLAEHDPAVALHFGVSKEARGFEIETQGRNRCRLAPDAAGWTPPFEHLLDEGAASHATTLPVARIVERLARLGLPARASDDAGGYLCNALLYHSLRHVDLRRPAMLAGFVHVPACLTGHGVSGGEPAPSCPLTWEDAVHGGLQIIAAALEDVPA
jgi:pyroglutamyl-peptidase